MEEKIKRACPRYVLLFQGGKIAVGGSTVESDGNYVQPTIVEISPTAAVVKEELFGPVLYVMKFEVVSLIENCLLLMAFMSLSSD